MSDPSDREPPEHFAPEQYPPDPVQHLRELMAKADRADGRHDHLLNNYSIHTASECMLAYDDAMSARNALHEALRNLAPQLLEVVDRVKTYERFHGDPVAGYVAQCALFDALAALGGKGEG